MSNVVEVKVPDIGDFKNIPVIEVFVKPGDTVKVEDALMTLESDKATMDVPSPASGVVKAILVKTGDKVSKGTPVLMLEPLAAPAAVATPVAKTAAAPVAVAPVAAPTAVPPAPVIPVAPAAAMAPQGSADSPAHASPSVRQFARELGVDLPRLQGSGPKNRILREDVQAFVKAQLAKTRNDAPGTSPAAGPGWNLPPMPQIDFSKFGAVESKPLSRIRKLSGGFLHRNWVSIPHVTQHDEADITELEAFRKSQAGEANRKGIKFTLLGFLMKASVVALKQFPEFNSSLSADGESLTLKQYFHIGVAVDTPNGLVVPVIRDVNKKGLLDIAQELGAVSERMRSGKIAPADVQGGCFSISSLGGLGGTMFTPIINAPEVAILGVGKATLKPLWDGKAFQPRLMLPLSLSYDHRVIDGAQGARFISFLSQTLADIRRLVL